MYWRALLMQPAVLAALSSVILGGQTQPAGQTWLHRAGVVLCLLAAMAGLASGWLWLSTLYSVEQAALYFSLACGLAALICLGLAHGLRLYRHWRMTRWQNKLLNAAQETAETALDDLQEFAHENPMPAAVLSLLAGYLLAGRAAEGTEKLFAALDSAKP